MHPETPSDPPRQHAAVAHSSLGELRLAYTDEGPRASASGATDGQPVVLIHGLPGSVRDFRWLAPALPDSWRLVRVELPGFGGSERPVATTRHRGLTLAQRAECVGHLLDALGVRAAVVVGHSAGGVVVGELARQRPDLVARAVLLASNGPTAHFPQWLYRGLALLFRSAPGRAVMAPLQRRLYAALGFPKYLTDDERMHSSLDAAAIDFARHRDNLTDLSVPTMTAWAEDDRLIPAPIFEATEALVPAGPRLRFPDGGHNLQKFRAVEIAAALVDWTRAPHSGRGLASG